jgi:hypothetical protein
MAALRLMLAFIEWRWPEYGYSWLLPEFERQSLCEIDFLQVFYECMGGISVCVGTSSMHDMCVCALTQEVNNAERMAQMFADNARIYVPRVYNDMSSARVIVMEYIDGCKVRPS